MMKIYVLFCLILFLSCSSKSDRYANFDLVINQGGSCKYDFEKEIYTVFYLEGPREIKFKLSEEEKKMIKENYYRLGLDESPKQITLGGTCNTMPMIFTVLHIKKANVVQEIQVEEGCSEYGIFTQAKARKVKDFLSLIRKIMSLRPEIKNLPRSNIPYI